MIKKMFLMLFFIGCYFIMPASYGKSSELLNTEMLYIDGRLLALYPVTEKSRHTIKKELVPLESIFPSLNAAEQRLYWQILAATSYYNQQYTQASALMTKAYSLNNKISKQQLYQPLFSKAHLLRADIYVALKEYDKAYLEKKAYLAEHYDYLQEKKDKMIASLSKKYETTNKAKKNELLVKQNKVKQLQIEKVQIESNTQQGNILLVLTVAIIFVLLIIRQFHDRKKLTLIAKTDGLTQLLNRQALFEHGKKIVCNEDTFINTENSQNRKNHNTNVILIDVDNFKKINDDYGHVIGDKVLKQFALLGEETMRSRDVFARLGGEEFVAILPELSLDEAKAIAERLKEKMSSQDFSVLGIKRPITLSVGLANLSLLPENTTFEALLHAADVAMYQAKDQGRDRVVIYQDHFN